MAANLAKIAFQDDVWGRQNMDTPTPILQRPLNWFIISPIHPCDERDLFSFCFRVS